MPSTDSRSSASSPVLLGTSSLHLEDLVSVARADRPVRLTDEARIRMNQARAAIDTLTVADNEAPRIYGVNTGFGALAESPVDAADIRALQLNLVRSHAAGIGDPMPTDAVRGMMLLRAAVLAQGLSGVRAALVDLLCEMLTRRVHPVVPWQGSVGASGDLAPLAHLALVLVGEGQAEVHGEILSGQEALARVGLAPIVLQAKEGLSLINGTQLMTAVGALALWDALALCRIADLTGVMSLETIKGSRGPFDPRVVGARPHPGALACARNLWRLTADSQIVESHAHCDKVQDAYSFRCMPQVHGACRDGLNFARQALEIEMNAVTDNPLVFVSGGAVDLISGGNFHGEPIAKALDYAAIAVAEFASVAERRIEQMLNPHLSGLPAFLAGSGDRKISGLHSGFMMAQVTAAALVSENKVLCHPASVDSIPSSAGREDHVSMGAHGAWKFHRVVRNVSAVLAIESLCAAEGLDLRRPLRPGPGIQAAHTQIRQHIAARQGDRMVHPDIVTLQNMILDGRLLAAVEAVTGPLD